MAVFRCAGRKRTDGRGNPLCDFESEESWKGRRCPGCRYYFNVEKVGVDKVNDGGNKLATAGEAVKIKVEHISTGVPILDKVLSGGVVKGSTVLFAGIPGGGKTSLLLEACDAMSDRTNEMTLYASSEESVERVQVVCNRLGIFNNNVKIISTKNIYEVLQLVEEHRPLVTVYDSLQNFRLGEVGATTHETVEIARLISEQTQQRKTCSVIVNQMAKDMSAKGSLDVPHLVETEVFLYRFDNAEDKRAVHALLDRSTRIAIRKGDIDEEKLRILIAGKNRDGEERLKAFFLMTKEGQIEPLKLAAEEG